MYVDNFQATANDVSELLLLHKEASCCLAKANMPLHGWNSSCTQFNSLIEDKEREVRASVLRILWDTQTDILSVKSVPVEEITDLTKCKALSIISKVYNPLGLLSPIIVNGKMFISRLWKANLSWDEPLNKELIAQFHQIIKDFCELESLAFPRSVCLKKRVYLNLS